MARFSGLRCGGRFAALLAAALPVMADASARALPYPGAWLARMSSACYSIQGHYLNQPLAVDDAGQRMQFLRLSGLLTESPLSTGSRHAGPLADHGASTGAARQAETRLALAREVLALTINPDGRVSMAVDGAPPTLSSPARCLGHGMREPAVVVDPIALEPGMSAEAPLGHLARIGIRKAKVDVFTMDGGDLILVLTVTKRVRREEAFGYPPMKHYWFRFARIEGPTL